LADRWEINFKVLTTFVAREGHSRVPRDHVEDAIRLGDWVSAQRSFRKSARLTASRIERLEALPGWTWHAKAAQWEDSFGELEALAARQGLARLPKGRDKSAVRIRTWVNHQRRFHRIGRLSAERTARLEALPGWSWDGDQAQVPRDII
jgi:hypothetical protein